MGLEEKMRCPKCKKESAKYIERRQRETVGSKDTIPRTDFKASCPKCKWQGEIL